MTPRPILLVDSREKTPLVFSADVDVERATLPTGDYSVRGCTDRIAIERKSLPDLVACVSRERERFLDCCRRLRDYELKAIVVEASLLDVEAHAYRGLVRPQSVIGTVLAIHADYGVPTVWAGNPHLAARVVEKLLVRTWRRDLEPAGAVAARVLSNLRPEGTPPDAA